MNYSQVIPWVLTGISILIAYLTYTRNGKKDDKEEFRKEESKIDGIKEGILKANMKLDAVCATTNETRSDIKSMTKDLIAMDRRVTVIEQSIKAMSADIEELKGKVNE